MIEGSEKRRDQQKLLSKKKYSDEDTKRYIQTQRKRGHNKGCLSRILYKHVLQHTFCCCSSDLTASKMSKYNRKKGKGMYYMANNSQSLFSRRFVSSF